MFLSSLFLLNHYVQLSKIRHNNMSFESILPDVVITDFHNIIYTITTW